MKTLKMILPIIGILFLASCGGGSGTAANNDVAVVGVESAAKISVVTAK